MSFLDSRHQRAAILVTLLGAGLAIALAPYASGLLGAPVLYVIFAPLHERLSRRIPARGSAVLVILLTVLLLVVPGIWLVGLIAGQAQQMTREVLQSALLERIGDVRVGGMELGPQVARIGQQTIAWLGGNALTLIGTATRFVLNLSFALFGLYFLLLNPHGVWSEVEPYVPFSPENINILRNRFRDVTTSTVIGTGVTALLQGALVGVGFAVTGLANPIFWSVVTAVFAVLPVVGSGIIWGPAVAALLLDGRTGAAVGLALWGFIVVANVDNVIRPIIYNRYARIHPLVTLVGAVAGVSYLGLLGLLIGPLAVSYFFEIARMYRMEYFTVTQAFPVQPYPFPSTSPDPEHRTQTGEGEIADAPS